MAGEKDRLPAFAQDRAVNSLDPVKGQNKTLQDRADDIRDNELPAVEILAAEIGANRMRVQVVVHFMPVISMIGGEEAPVLIVTTTVAEICLGEDAARGRAEARSFGGVFSLHA